MLKSFLKGVTIGYFIVAIVFEYSKTLPPHTNTVEASESIEISSVPSPCELIDVVCDYENKTPLQVKSESSKETSKSDIEQIIREVFKEDAKVAVAVFKAESNLRADAVGDRHIEFTQNGVTMGHSCGIAQIRVLAGRPNCEQLKDARFNVEYAKKMFDRSGFKPWSAYNNKRYLIYL